MCSDYSTFVISCHFYVIYNTLLFYKEEQGIYIYIHHLAYISRLIVSFRKKDPRSGARVKKGWGEGGRKG